MMRRSGFTLTELVITTTVLVVVAAMVVPNMAHMRDNQLARDLVPSMQRLVTYAREQAVSQHTTAVLSFDQSTTTLAVKQDTTVDQNAPTVSAISASQGPTSSSLPSQSGGAPIAIPTSATIDANNPTINKTVVVPSTLQLTDFQLAGKTVSEPDFQVRFYPDGTCDSGGIGFTLGGATQSIVIDDFGRTTVADGPLPDPTSQKWEAGQFEPRANATQ
jgi:prepilin-type N-terminal cleavage/methylation domain-containing protein